MKENCPSNVKTSVDKVSSHESDKDSWKRWKTLVRILKWFALGHSRFDGRRRCDGAPRFLASSRSSATRTRSFHFHRDRGNAYLLRCATDKGVTARRTRLTMTRNFDRGSDIHNLPLNSRTRANSTFHLASSSAPPWCEEIWPLQLAAGTSNCRHDHKSSDFGKQEFSLWQAYTGQQELNVRRMHAL